METLQSNNNAELQSSSDFQDWEVDMSNIINKTNFGYYRTRSEIHYGPPPDWNEPTPNHSMEVFIGALPRDVNIYELIQLIEEKVGENCIYELSLMLDLTHNMASARVLRNRGFAFVTFQSKEMAQKCREALDNKEIRAGKRIRINQSTPNLHLFVANVPSNKSREEILRDLREYTDGLKDVIIFAAKTGSGDMDTKRHRGFIFLEYETHSAAANARKKLSKPGFRLWNRELKVDWAAKKQEPSQEVMSKVKSIYVRNLTAECTDQNLRDYFTKYGEIESIKKVRDFAFIHFKDRSAAVEALADSNKTVLPESASNGTIDVELVKPNINCQYKSALGCFPFTNLMSAAPFLPYPYGLPMPPPPPPHPHPPPAHMMPPPPHHLMYGSTNSGYFPFNNKNKSWNFMNGNKHPNFHNYMRQHKMNSHMNSNSNRQGSDHVGTNPKWNNNGGGGNHQNYDNSGGGGGHTGNNSYDRHHTVVNASGDNSNNSPTSRPENSQPNAFDVNKRVKSMKQQANNCANPQALFYWGVSHNDLMYRDSPFLGW